MAEDGDDHVWVRRIGLYRYVYHPAQVGCTVFLLFLILIPLTLFVSKSFWLGFPLLAIGGFASHLFLRHRFLNRIVCPRCGFNPTRRKSDGAVRKDDYKVLAQLERFTECPNCGHDGREGIEVEVSKVERVE